MPLQNLLQIHVLKYVFLALFIFPFWSKIRIKVGLSFFCVIVTFKFIKPFCGSIQHAICKPEAAILYKKLYSFCQASQTSFRRKNCDKFPKTPRQTYQLWKSFWFLHFKASDYSVSLGQQWSLSLPCTRPFSHPFNSLITAIPLSGKQPHQWCAQAIGFVSKVSQGLIMKLQRGCNFLGTFSRYEDPVFISSLLRQFNWYSLAWI